MQPFKLNNLLFNLTLKLFLGGINGYFWYACKREFTMCC